MPTEPQWLGLPSVAFPMTGRRSVGSSRWERDCDLMWPCTTTGCPISAQKKNAEAYIEDVAPVHLKPFHIRPYGGPRFNNQSVCQQALLACLGLSIFQVLEAEFWPRSLPALLVSSEHPHCRPVSQSFRDCNHRPLRWRQNSCHAHAFPSRRFGRFRCADEARPRLRSKRVGEKNRGRFPIRPSVRRERWCGRDRVLL